MPIVKDFMRLLLYTADSLLFQFDYEGSFVNSICKYTPRLKSRILVKKVIL